MVQTRQARRMRPPTRAITAMLAGGALIFAFPGPASADVTAVKGSAYGYFLSVGLFGGPPNTSGPTPTVTLAPDASNSPQVATAPGAAVSVGPARFFTSGRLDVSAQGTLGPTGSATTTTSVANITRTQGEVFGATSVSSSCRSSTSGALSGTTTIAGGVLQTDSGNDLNGDGDFIDPGEHAPVNVPVPINPAPNTVIAGHIHVNGSQDNFEYKFNEQITNPDGSITVYAAHQRLTGPTAVGDLFIAKAECGLTGSPAPPPAVPEVPWAVLLPLGAIAALGGTVLVRRRAEA